MLVELYLCIDKSVYGLWDARCVWVPVWFISCSYRLLSYPHRLRMIVFISTCTRLPDSDKPFSHP
jgi:hypothetical protein